MVKVLQRNQQPTNGLVVSEAEEMRLKMNPTAAGHAHPFVWKT